MNTLLSGLTKSTALSIFFIIFSIAHGSLQAQVCLQRRGVLEIGSGSTKAFAAVVDICDKKIHEVLFEDQKPIPFNDVLQRSEKKEIPFTYLNEVVPRIQELVERMRKLEIKEISGIATSAFRVASNGDAALVELSKKLKIPFKMIPQSLEAEIGAISAMAQKRIPLSQKQSVIIWDIGGGSMQMWGKSPLGSEEIYQGDLASISFKNKVIQDIHRKDIQKVDSPNPLGAKKSSVVRLARSHAQEKVPGFFKNKSSDVRWIGIGGVLSLSVQKQIDDKKSEFTLKQLKQVLDKRAHLKDEQIPSDYRTTEVTNLALVLGYMEALGIQTVETTTAPLAQGWILYQLSP